MNLANFNCNACKVQFFVPTFRSYIGGKFSLKNGNPIKCECGSASVSIIDKPFEGIPALGKFTMLSSDDRKKSLKKRSADHSKKIANEMRNSNVKF
jgi:hypothetical protein